MFGKSEYPFGDPEKEYKKVRILGKSKTYGMRNIPYKQLANELKNFQSVGNIENTLKGCRMKRTIKFLLEDKEDI